MKRCAIVVAVVLTGVLLGGCHLLVDRRIRESAAIDYAVVKTTVQEIDAGDLSNDAAVEVLRRLARSMRHRVRYFEGAEPEAIDGEGSDGSMRKDSVDDR